MHIINQYAVKKMAYDGKNTRNIVALKQIQSLKYPNIDATLEQQVDKTIDKKNSHPDPSIIAVMNILWPPSLSSTL